MPGEFGFIRWIMSQWRGRTGERVVVPPGDDLAVLKWSDDDLLIVGVDQVLDGVHFDSAVHSPRDIGRKVMNRNLSDCAAMACLPAAAVATAALPKGASLDYAKDLYLGMSDAGNAFDCPVVGGDTASWNGKLVLTLTILGRSAGIQPVTRAGAKVGDTIYVTGPLGGSILGRHMSFTPRVAVARELAKTGISAMIDLSDGLSRDLRHICERSGVGAILEADRIPVHVDVSRLAATSTPPLEHALHDGEDYELCFTSAVDHSSRATPIGTITAGDKLLIKHADDRVEELKVGGFEHSL
jgi:thiamine-monophosphate kinase